MNAKDFVEEVRATAAQAHASLEYLFSLLTHPENSREINLIVNDSYEDETLRKASQAASAFADAARSLQQSSYVIHDGNGNAKIEKVDYK